MRGGRRQNEKVRYLTGRKASSCSASVASASRSDAAAMRGAASRAAWSAFARAWARRFDGGKSPACARAISCSYAKRVAVYAQPLGAYFAAFERSSYGKKLPRGRATRLRNDTKVAVRLSPRFTRPGVMY